MTSLRSLLLIAVLLGALGAAVWIARPIDAAPVRQTLGTTTPTATRSRPLISNEITYPTSSDILIRSALIEGTAIIDDFVQFQIHISPAGLEDWSWLVTKFTPVIEGPLHVFDTRPFADGYYDLRLRAINRLGNYSESFVHSFRIQNVDPPTPTPQPVPTDETGSPLATASPLETATPTPTATPFEIAFLPGGAGIYYPSTGDRVGSYVRIVGTANAPDPFHRFRRYEIYVSPAGLEDWTWLFSSQQQFYNDTLYIWNSSEAPDGYYDLRMRIVYRDSNYDEFFVRDVLVQNGAAPVSPRPAIEVTAPRDGAFVSQVVDVVGTIAPPDLERWELYWSEADGGAWIFLFSGDYVVVDDLIARVDLRNVSPGPYDLRLRVVDRRGNFRDLVIPRLHVVRPTPTPHFRPAH